MKFARTILAAVAAAVGLSLAAFPAAAKPDFSAKEKEPCATCHVTPGKPELNDVGKCYKRHGHKDLKECKKDPSK